MKKKSKIRISAAEFAFVLALVSVGVFHEYLSCLFSVGLMGILLWEAQKNKGLIFVFSAATRFLLGLSAALLLGILWAVDAGMAFIGFLKFLPLLLFGILLMQEDHRGEILDHLPYIAGALAILSAILKSVPFASEYFSLSGRMAGFFQYPNAFASFLLASEVLLVAKDKLRWFEILLAAVLAGGVLYTGSRFVFVIALVVNLLVFFTGKGKKRKWIMLGVILAGIAGLFLYARFSGADNAITRLFSLSFKESTLIGRVLYLYDALPLALKHPFGMGYMGYYYMQSSVQTGVYTTTYVHCEPMQLLLDAGWIPFALAVAAIVHFFRSKDATRSEKLAFLALLLHSCVDFDFQFIAMGFFVLILMPKADGKRYVLLKKKASRWIAASLAAAGCLYMSVALGLSRFGLIVKADALYPFNTQNQINLMLSLSDADQAGEVADRVLQRNKHIRTAYSAKARQAYMKGDFGEVIRMKREIIEIGTFSHSEFYEYARYLMRGITLYREKGDEKSAGYCLEELFKIQEEMAALPDRLSPLGRAISYQPKTQLPEDVQEFIRQEKENAK